MASVERVTVTLPMDLVRDIDRREQDRGKFIAEAVRWKKSDVGIDFLVSPDFGEWLNEEATAINPQTLKSLCYPEIVASKGRFAAISTGKYKSMKVGFRLCYLGEIPPVESPASTTATK